LRHLLLCHEPVAPAALNFLSLQKMSYNSLVLYIEWRKKVQFYHFFHEFQNFFLKNFFSKFFSKNDPIRGNFGNRLHAFPKRENACMALIQDKNAKKLHFRFKTPSFSLNQGSIFTLRECVQSIPRIELPLIGSF
jgi:hypothetical protein